MAGRNSIAVGLTALCNMTLQFREKWASKLLSGHVTRWFVHSYSRVNSISWRHE